MYILQIYLYDEYYLTDLMLAMTACIEAPAIMTQGVVSDQYLADSMPMFSDIASGAHSGERYCKVITVPTSDPNVLKLLRMALESGGIDMFREEIISAVLLPVADAFGMFGMGAG